MPHLAHPGTNSAAAANDHANGKRAHGDDQHDLQGAALVVPQITPNFITNDAHDLPLVFDGFILALIVSADTPLKVYLSDFTATSNAVG
jgi:hypothetical protein